MITRHPLPHRPGDRQALDPNVLVVAVRGSVPCKPYRCPLSRCMRLTGCLGLSVMYDCYGHGPKLYLRLVTPAAHNRISRLPNRCLRFRCPWTVACTPLPHTPKLNLCLTCSHVLSSDCGPACSQLHVGNIPSVYPCTGKKRDGVRSWNRKLEHICMMDRRETS